MKKARSSYTDRLRTRLLLCIWCALAAAILAALPVASQSALQPNSYLPLIVADVAPPPSPTPAIAIANARPIANTRAIADARAIANPAAIAAGIRLRYGDEQYHA